MAEVSILFVCMGNICRSPAADGLFIDHVEQHQLQHLKNAIRIDSAGTHGYHIGDRADPRMRKSAAARGHDLKSRARCVTAEDLHDFDLVLAMDRENLQGIESLDPDESRTAELLLFSHFLSDEWPTDVPDPYYGGDDGFEYVLDMIQAGCQPIVEWLHVRIQERGES